MTIYILGDCKRIVRIRSVRKTDVNSVCEINQSCWPGWNVSEKYKNAMIKRPVNFYMGGITESLNDPNKKMLVADNGEVVGYVVAVPPGMRGEIKVLLVSPKAQRQRLGKKLLRAVLKKFSNVERRKVKTLYNNEKGKSFYKKIGFRIKRYSESKHSGFKIREAVLYANREIVFSQL